jgi:hypothetical protein
LEQQKNGRVESTSHEVISEGKKVKTRHRRDVRERGITKTFPKERESVGVEEKREATEANEQRLRCLQETNWKNAGETSGDGLG